MKSMGPGRYREIPAMMSSRLWGFSSFMKFFMPVLSSWNTPSVLPVPRESSTRFDRQNQCDRCRCAFHVLFSTMLHRVLDHRQGPKAQEIHFQKAQFFQRRHGKLGGDGTVGCPGQGHVLVHCLLADDHARRMHGRVPGQPLQPLGHVDQVLHPLVSLVYLAQLRDFLSAPCLW